MQQIRYNRIGKQNKVSRKQQKDKKIENTKEGSNNVEGRVTTIEFLKKKRRNIGQRQDLNIAYLMKAINQHV